MDRTHAVRDILIACTAEPSPKDLALRGSDALLAIIAEVDRTLLARRLDCRFVGGLRLSLFVQNRRLHRLSAEPDHNAEAFGTELGPDQAHVAAQAIGGLCHGHVLQRITPISTQDAAEYQSIGISTARLSLSAGIDPNPAPWAQMQHRFAQFQSTHAEHVAAAYTMVGEDVAPTAGTDAAIERYFDDVLRLLQSIANPEFALAQMLETEGAILTPHPGVKGGCILVVGTTGTLTVAVVKDLSVIEAWSALRPYPCPT